MPLHLLLPLTILLWSTPALSEEVSVFKYASDSIVLDFQYPVATLTIAASGRVWGFLREFGHGPIPQRLDCAGHFKTTLTPQKMDELLREIEEMTVAKYGRNAFLQSPDELARETTFGTTETFPATISFDLANYRPKGQKWQGPIQKKFALRYLLAGDLPESMQDRAKITQPISAVGQMLIKRVTKLACKAQTENE